MSEVGKIRFYADVNCSTPLETIEWDGGFVVTLCTGEKAELRNTAVAGKVAVATFYIRNEEKYRYAVTNISHSDSRIKVRIEKGWLLPNAPVKIVVSYRVPNLLTAENIIKKGIIKVEGYYVMGDD